MKVRGIRKNPGFSALEVDYAFHEFVAGTERTHRRMMFTILSYSGLR